MSSIIKSSAFDASSVQFSKLFKNTNGGKVSLIMSSLASLKRSPTARGHFMSACSLANSTSQAVYLSAKDGSKIHIQLPWMRTPFGCETKCACTLCELR